LLAFLLAFALFSGNGLARFEHADGSYLVPVEDIAPIEGFAPKEDIAPIEGLHDRLMEEFYGMNRDRRGVFQDDVTAMIAPYFPPGQSFAETEKLVREQQLGTLQKFKGMQDPDGTMFVTKFSLMTGMFSEVYVVLHFDFHGTTDADMTLKRVAGYIRGGSM
jgi:hypothetical protein